MSGYRPPVTQPVQRDGHPAHPGADEPGQVARRRAAVSLQNLLDRLTYTDAEPAAFGTVADRLDALADGLPSSESPDVLLAARAFGWRGLLLPALTFDRSDPAELVIRTRIGVALEGVPGRAHGGVVAYLIDSCLGQAALHTRGAATLTGTLSVRYTGPTPTETDLVLRAWVDRVDGRKHYVLAELRAGDVVTTTAEAVMIERRPGTF